MGNDEESFRILQTNLGERVIYHGVKDEVLKSGRINAYGYGTAMEGQKLKRGGSCACPGASNAAQAQTRTD